MGDIVFTEISCIVFEWENGSFGLLLDVNCILFPVSDDNGDSFVQLFKKKIHNVSEI